MRNDRPETANFPAHLIAFGKSTSSWKRKTNAKVGSGKLLPVRFIMHERLGRGTCNLHDKRPTPTAPNIFQLKTYGKCVRDAIYHVGPNLNIQFYVSAKAEGSLCCDRELFFYRNMALRARVYRRVFSWRSAMRKLDLLSDGYLVLGVCGMDAGLRRVVSFCGEVSYDVLGFALFV